MAEHGKRSTYSRGCRCRECTDANTRYVNRWLRTSGERSVQLPRQPGGLAANDPRHGTVNGYINCRCRCDKCSGAHSDYLRARRSPSPRRGGDASGEGLTTP